MSKLGPRLVARSFAIVVVAAVTGCHADSGHRVHHPDAGLSVDELVGWTESRAPGALVFFEPGSGATITIRTGEILPGRSAHLDDLAATARRELDRLASASVDPPVPLDHATMTGALFRFSFRPPDRIGVYGGRQAVLVGERHFYHVVLTVPALELASATAPFFHTVSSVREE